MAQPGGVLSRAGHTEAASDLAQLAGFEPAGVLVEILNPDGSMARRPELEVFAREHGLKIGSIEDLIRYRLATEHTVERVDEREIDTEHGAFTLHTYRDRVSRALHFALLRGEADARVPIARARACAQSAGRRRALAPTGFRPRGGRRAARPSPPKAAVHSSCWASRRTPTPMLARIREQPRAPQDRAGALAEWRRTGAGSQILADLGLGKLRVLGTPRKQVGLAGFGLEVVAHVEWPAR